MLQPDPHHPGRWHDPARHPDAPGLFAVIAGISAYPHLRGGPEPAPETFGLGQLFVSALTARRVFDWLRVAYRGPPVAEVWLHLEPSEAELAHLPDLADGAAPATFDALRDTLRAWKASMRRLPSQAASSSTALFFYSGHGIDVHSAKQLLLPSKWPLPSIDDALSTLNIRHGLEDAGVLRQLFFLDACRNGSQTLRNQGLRGARVFPETVADAVPLGLSQALFYATQRGQAAWSPARPEEGPSLFGRALLDGLRGHPNLELQPDDQLHTVRVDPLERYLKARVPQLLERLGASVHQPVRVDGEHDDHPITWLEAPPADLPPDPPAVAHLHPIGPGAAIDLARGAPSPPEPVRKLRARITLPLKAADTAPPLAQQIPLHAPDAASPAHLTPLPDGRYRLPAPHHPCWLQVGGLGCVVAGDLPIDLDLERHADRVRRLDATCAPGGHGRETRAAELWTAWWEGGSGDLQRLTPQDWIALEDLLWGKRRAPFAALVASLVLLRGRQWDRLHDWLRNLATWFPHLPDGAALWAHQVLERRHLADDPAGEATRWMIELHQRGLPWTTDGLSHAAVVLERLPDQAELDPVRKRITTALRAHRGGALFATYHAHLPLDIILPERP